MMMTDGVFAPSLFALSRRSISGPTRSSSLERNASRTCAGSAVPVMRESVRSSSTSCAEASAPTSASSNVSSTSSQSASERFVLGQDVEQCLAEGIRRPGKLGAQPFDAGARALRLVQRGLDGGLRRNDRRCGRFRHGARLRRVAGGGRRCGLPGGLRFRRLGPARFPIGSPLVADGGGRRLFLLRLAIRGTAGVQIPDNRDDGDNNNGGYNADDHIRFHDTKPKNRNGQGLGTHPPTLVHMANSSRMTSLQRREQLIRIGRSLFASKGFEAVSVEEIAASAKVSKPIVYEHFGGKEGLYAVVVDREMRALTEAPVVRAGHPLRPSAADRGTHGAGAAHLHRGECRRLPGARARFAVHRPGRLVQLAAGRGQHEGRGAAGRLVQAAQTADQGCAVLCADARRHDPCSPDSTGRTSAKSARNSWPHISSIWRGMACHGWRPNPRCGSRGPRPSATPRRPPRCRRPPSSPSNR